MLLLSACPPCNRVNIPSRPPFSPALPLVLGGATLALGAHMVFGVHVWSISAADFKLGVYAFAHLGVVTTAAGRCELGSSPHPVRARIYDGDAFLWGCVYASVIIGLFGLVLVMVPVWLLMIDAMRVKAA